GGIPVPVMWTEVPVVYSDGRELGRVLACLVGEKEHAHAGDAAPFTLAGEIFERGKHKDLIRIFVPFGSDATRRATGVLEVGYHRSDHRRPARRQGQALRAAAGQLAAAVETAPPSEGAQRQAQQLVLAADLAQRVARPV